MNRILKNPYSWLAFIILGLVTVIFLTYANYGKTWDENDTVALGDHAFTYYTSLGRDTSYFTFYPQKEFILTRGPAIEALRAGIMHIFNNHSTEFYHLIIAFFAVSTIIFVYLILYEMTQKISWSILGVSMLLLLPRFYGDMFTNSKDVAPLYLFLGCMYFSLKSFTKKKKLIPIVLFGVFLGLASSMRIALLYILPLFMAFYAYRTITIEKAPWKNTLISLLILMFVTCASLYLFQPYLLTHPLTGIIDMYTASQKFPQDLQMYFDGKIIHSNNLPWYYLPKYIAITTPLVQLILFTLGNVFILLRKKTISYLYVLLLFWLPLISGIILKPVLYDGWRHFLFLYAPLTIIAAIGLRETYAVLPKKVNMVFLSVVGIGLILILISMIQLHPYEYAYFNELVGGTRGAYGKYDIDYWGESFKEATLWIDAHQQQFASKDGITYVNPCVPMLAQPYLIPKVKIDGALATLYYCINRPMLFNPGYYHIVYVVQRHGVPMNIILSK